MIKFLVMDVDGTLTDGKINIGENGELFKSFNIKDGCGIKDILPDYGIIPVIITGRTSRIVEYRSKELNISYCFQGERNKRRKLLEVISEFNSSSQIGYTLGDCAYIGDDINDLDCMQAVKDHGGIIGAPRDAISQIISLADFVSKKNAGEGAVRDFIEWLIK